MSDKIKVINCTNGQCVIKNDELRIDRHWNGRGAVCTFTKDQIEELMYMPAFSNMVKRGMLFIDDMDLKKELGVEPEDAVEPTLKLLTDKELERYWKNMPAAQFKLEIETLTPRQIKEVAQYAMLHGEDGSIEKAALLTKLSGYEVLKGIELEKADKGD